MALVAAFDVATQTGVCCGTVGAAPSVETWDLGKGTKGRPEKLAKFLYLLRNYFSIPGRKIDAVYYELPVNMRALMQIGATEETIALLRGAIGVLEAMAAECGIHTIEGVNVQAARQALTGQRTFSKTKGGYGAKIAVMNAARTMGVEVKTDHEADAYAVWWYACALHNPRIAHLSQPLFARRR